MKAKKDINATENIKRKEIREPDRTPIAPFAAAAVALTVRDPLAAAAATAAAAAAATAAAATAAAATAAATAVATSERQCFVSSPQLLPQFARAHYRYVANFSNATAMTTESIDVCVVVIGASSGELDSGEQVVVSG